MHVLVFDKSNTMCHLINWVVPSQGRIFHPHDNEVKKMNEWYKTFYLFYNSFY